MTLDIALLIATIIIALILFSLDWLPSDVIALGVLATLVLTGLLPVDQAFDGFGSDVVIMILGLLILTAALLRTGVVEQVGRTIIRRIGNQPGWLLVVVMVSSAFVGAFMSNTASTAFFIPVVIGIARKARMSASKLLMPLAFSSILSSSVTLISTSTNIVVSGLMVRAGLQPMGMFELAPVGIPIMIIGIAYVILIGSKIIPDRLQPGFEEMNILPYLTELVILKGSSLAGKTLAEIGLGRDLDLTVLRVARGKNQYLAPQAALKVEVGDILLVEGQREEILKIKGTAGIDIKADVKLSDRSLQSDDVRLAEVILLTGSPLIGRTLKGARFRELYELQVLAIHRKGKTIRRKISQIRLRLGDVLLIQGHKSQVASLNADNNFRVLSSDEKIPDWGRAPYAIFAFVGAIALASFNIVPLAIAVILGVLVVFVTRCITPEEAYRIVEWKALILIGSMLGLGAAMKHTGTDEFLAMQIVSALSHTSPIWLLAGFFVLTVLLTQPMSNQAAAIVIVPIALQTAVQLNLNPRAFAMMIAIAASCSYLTPLEPSCLMVYGPGNYKFADFLKVGSLLTVLIFILALWMVPRIWPL